MFDRNRVRSARLALQLSRERLAILIGVSMDTITKIENGDRLPSLPTLRKLCNTLEVSADFLMCRTDVNPQKILETGEKIDKLLSHFQVNSDT